MLVMVSYLKPCLSILKLQCESWLHAPSATHLEIDLKWAAAIANMTHLALYIPGNKAGLYCTLQSSEVKQLLQLSRSFLLLRVAL